MLLNFNGGEIVLLSYIEDKTSLILAVALTHNDVKTAGALTDKYLNCMLDKHFRTKLP